MEYYRGGKTERERCREVGSRAGRKKGAYEGSKERRKEGKYVVER